MEVRACKFHIANASGLECSVNIVRIVAERSLELTVSWESRQEVLDLKLQRVNLEVVD